MRLSELVRGLGLAGPVGADPEVTGVEHDSRRVRPGDLFVALPGERFDGRAFAAAAVAAGAVAVVGPEPVAAGAAVAVPWLVAASPGGPRALLGPLAARAYGHPERELILAGVTGTNGKSTVATLTAAILTAAGLPAGFIGTISYRFGDKAYAGAHTTPEASDLFRLLRAMRDDGAASRSPWKSPPTLWRWGGWKAPGSTPRRSPTSPATTSTTTPTWRTTSPPSAGCSTC